MVSKRMGGVANWCYGGWVTCAWRVLIQSITCIGVDLFILISGYFSIRPKVKSLLNLFTCLAFFYVGCYLLNYFLTGNFSFRDLIVQSMAFSRENWFIQCYLFLILLAPVLNSFFEHSNYRQATIFIVVYVLCALYFGCIRNSNYFYFNRGYSVTTLLLVYSVGRYYRLFIADRLKELKTGTVVWIYLSTVGLLSLSFMFNKGGIDWLMNWYCSPLTIISALLLFEWFSRLRFNNKLVNWIGSSCLAAYVLHTSSPVISWFASYDVQLFLNTPLWHWILKIFVVILLIFLTAILLDKIRLMIFNPIIKWSGKIDEKIKLYVRE